MRLPRDAENLKDLALELITECFVSREARRNQIRNWHAYYWNGASSGAQVEYNRIFEHVDRLQSFLFSPTDVRFDMEFDETESDEIQAMARASTRQINREFHRHNLDLDFAEAVKWALVDGACMLKQIWGFQGPEAYLVRPQFFGVLREDVSDLDKQEAFVHRTYMTKSSFRRTILEHPDRAVIMKKIDSMAEANKNADEVTDDYIHQVIIGSVASSTSQPVSQTASTGKGIVGVTGGPSPQLAPEVAARLLAIDELWVIDDERQDYTTIRMVGDLMVEGKYKRRNLAGPADTLPTSKDTKGMHPFTKVCPNEVDGYFWGQSEVMQIYRLQDSLNEQMADLRTMSRKNADPSVAFIGFSGMTLEKWKALKRRGGFVSEDSPGAKVEKMGDPIPESAFVRLDKTIQQFDSIAGFQPILQGQGEPGVRAGIHAQTLARNASPRMRDRALLVERQCVEFGDFTFQLLKAKKAEVIDTETKAKFTLDQLPGEARLTVDSHTSSPAFQEDSNQLAFALKKAQAIDSEALIMLTHPPHEDTLRARAKKAAQAQAAFLAAHPEAATKGKGKK